MSAHASEIAESIVDAFRRGSLDHDELEEAIRKAIELGQAPKSQPYDPERRKRYIAEVRADPERLANYMETRRRADRKRYERDPQRHAERQKEKRRCRIERDPEAERKRIREKERRRRERGGEALKAKDRRKSRAQASEAHKAKVSAEIRKTARAAIPTGYPAHAREDIIGAVLLRYWDGHIGRDEVRAETKKRTTAYWKNRDDYRSSSLDAQRFDDGKSTLHDTVSEGLWS